MKYAAILILLVASATAIPIEESVTTEAENRERFLERYPMASNMTELIHYLVQLEVNKTVAALAAIKNTAVVIDSSFHELYQQALAAATAYSRPIWMYFTSPGATAQRKPQVFFPPSESYGRRHPRPIAEDFFRAEQISKSDYYAQYEPSVTIPLRNLMALLRSMPNHAADV